jgi:CheY-like chemotaxis protein
MKEIKVLIIEDDESAQFLNKVTFKRSGIQWDVDAVFNGKEALDYLSKNAANPPQIILCDINMPVMDGHTFLSEYSQHFAAKLKCKVYILSSSQLDKDKEAVAAYPFVLGYIEKPLLNPHLLMMLNHMQENESLSEDNTA